MTIRGSFSLSCTAAKLRQAERMSDTRFAASCVGPVRVECVPRRRRFGRRLVCKRRFK